MNDIGMQIFAFLVELAGIHQLSELVNSLDGMDQATKDFFSVIGVVISIFGLLQCFFGYKLFKFWCSVVGLLVGGSVGIALAASGVFSASPAASLIGLLLIVILGIVGAFIAYRAYLVGLFIYSFCTAFLIGFVLFAVISDSLIIGLGVGIAAGIAMGVIAVMYRRFWIIVATSISGGTSICGGLMMVTQTTELGWTFLLPVVLAVAGFFVQNMTVKKNKGKSAHHHEPDTPVSQVYPAEHPPLYPPVDPDAVTQPLPPDASQSGVYQNTPGPVNANPGEYKCVNCGYTPQSNTAPCNNCGSAVHVNSIPEYYTD